MAASKKVIENSNRLRYVRALQRFQKSIVSFLSTSEELTKERYDKKVENALKVLKRIEPSQLYKGEFQDLETYVNKMIEYKNFDEDVEVIRENLLYSANQLEKSKNARRYKKDKHSQSKFEDWE